MLDRVITNIGSFVTPEELLVDHTAVPYFGNS